MIERFAPFATKAVRDRSDQREQFATEIGDESDLREAHAIGRICDLGFATGEIMEARQCTKCGKTSTSAAKCSHCGFEFPQARTRDDEREDRQFNEGKRSSSESTEGTMDDAMKSPLKVPPPEK